MVFLLTLLVAALGAAPLLFSSSKGTSRLLAAGIVAGAIVATGFPILYFGKVSLAPPLWGLYGVFVLGGWVLSAVIDGVGAERVTYLTGVAAVGAVVVLGRACTGCAAFRSDDYAKMIGHVEERVWTEDVQPADPGHIRLVPHEMALWLGNKQLGESGAIGSQYQISSEGLTLQRIKGELWYVAPLDYRSFSTWQSSDHAPGYVMVHGEDPKRPVVVKADERFLYTPGAYFGKSLERHLQDAGYRDVGLTDYSLEIDEAGKAWWVVSVYEYTIGYAGEKVTGVVVVDPTTGDTSYHGIGQVPDWIDRVVPKSFAKTYIADWGKYRGGWVNSWWGKRDLTEPEEPSLVYGHDGDPYWVTGITSTNENDEALIGLVYTDARTGVSTLYRTSGGTDAAILQAVNNKVSFRKWHGASPVVYNINGTMASVVPLLGENHTFQGVAIVNIENPQYVALGDNQYQALREYQRLMAQSGDHASIDANKQAATRRGKVDRIAAEATPSGTSYYLFLEGGAKVYTAGSEISPELSLTRSGDEVEITCLETSDDVLTMLSFDNLALPFAPPKREAPAKEPADEAAPETP